MPPSRARVQVVVCDSRSTWPESSSGKRAAALTGV